MQLNGKNENFTASAADFVNLVHILGLVELALKKLVEENR
jgi:hypothetical protein